MKSNLFALIFFGLSLQSGVAAQAADLVISTGKSGGGYNAVGERLKTVMAEQGVTVEVLTSVGSVENLKRLNDPNSPVSVGLTQADALNYYLGQQPQLADKLMMLGDIGKECVFIITGKDSDIKSDGDLQDKKDYLIAVQSPNSGVAVTYEYMVQLEPKFKNTAPAFIDTMEALLQIKAGGQSKIKAAMLVQRPSAKSPAMQVVLGSPKEFHFVPVKDWDLNDKLPDGRAVYSFEEVTVEEKKWGFDTSVDTICTQGLLVASKDKLNPELRANLAKVMLLAGSRVVGEEN
ncbi:MAG: hypothetical protein HC808_14120 [Candidatus Competibacteraceae bacterium]|nr:hypothetical protein [Candidatus Competibacteraceae bacterium]